jgi:hypothetical protein
MVELTRRSVGAGAAKKVAAAAAHQIHSSTIYSLHFPTHAATIAFVLKNDVKTLREALRNFRSILLTLRSNAADDTNGADTTTGNIYRSER